MSGDRIPTPRILPARPRAPWLLGAGWLVTLLIVAILGYAGGRIGALPALDAGIARVMASMPAPPSLPDSGLPATPAGSLALTGDLLPAGTPGTAVPVAPGLSLTPLPRSLAAEGAPPQRQTGNGASTAQTGAAGSADGPGRQAPIELQLVDVRISRAESPRHYRYQFELQQPEGIVEQVFGTVWLGIDGTSDGEPLWLSLRKLSPEGNHFIPMSLDRVQRVTGTLELPAGFKPRSLNLEIKPALSGYASTTRSLDWAAVLD